MIEIFRSTIALILFISTAVTVILFFLTEGKETARFILKGETSVPNLQDTGSGVRNGIFNDPFKKHLAATANTLHNPTVYAREVNKFLVEEHNKILDGTFLSDYNPVFLNSNEMTEDEQKEWLELEKIRMTKTVEYYYGILSKRRAKQQWAREYTKRFETNNQVKEESEAKKMPHKGEADLKKKDQRHNIWDKFAYMTYATSTDYLCNALMLFDQLRNVHKTQARVSLMYPQEWGVPDNTYEQLADKKAGKETKRMKFLRKAQDEFNVDLIPVVPLAVSSSKDATWKESFTKILVFNQTQYERVLMLDSDAYLLDNLDYMFLENLDKSDKNAILSPEERYEEKEPDEKFPAVEGAPPYWLSLPSERYSFATILELVSPTRKNFRRVISRFLKLIDDIDSDKKDPNDPETLTNFYDMELTNDVFADQKPSSKKNDNDGEYEEETETEKWKNSYAVRDHRGLFMLSGELSQQEHTKFLTNYIANTTALDTGSQLQIKDLWNPNFAFATTAYIHFSDWPFPKVCSSLSFSNLKFY